MSEDRMAEHVAVLDADARELYIAIVTCPKATPEMACAIGRITGRLQFLRAVLPSPVALPAVPA